jgi:hypothetical protein
MISAHFSELPPNREFSDDLTFLVTNPMHSDLRPFPDIRTASYAPEVPRFRLEIAKGCHKALDLAGRQGFAGFEIALDA